MDFFTPGTETRAVHPSTPTVSASPLAAHFGERQLVVSFLQPLACLIFLATVHFVARAALHELFEREPSSVKILDAAKLLIPDLGSAATLFFVRLHHDDIVGSSLPRGSSRYESALQARPVFAGCRLQL